MAEETECPTNETHKEKDGKEKKPTKSRKTPTKNKAVTTKIIEGKIENNRRGLQNLEIEMLSKLERYELRYNTMLSSMAEAKNNFNNSITKTINLEKELASLKNTVKEEKETRKKERNENEENKEKIKEQRLEIEKHKETIVTQSYEINELKQELMKNQELQNMKDDLNSNVADIETRLNNKRKEEANRITLITEGQNKLIADLTRQMKTKAQMSEVDKIKENFNNTKINGQVENNKYEHDKKNNTSTENVNNNTEKKRTKASTILLMDSNSKYIDFDKFGRNTKKVKTSQAKDLEKIIDEYDFDEAKHIIISTGTNDTDYDEAEEIFDKLKQAAIKLKNIYKDAYIYISHIPPRKYLHKEEVNKLNLL